MARTTRRILVWTVMLAGCSSQPFCDFHDTAPIVALPVPDEVSSAWGWGTVMIPVSWMEGEHARDFVAAAGGPHSQTEVIQVAEEGELLLASNPLLSGICDREEAEDEESDCYERHAGVGLAYRSEWDNSDGENCIAIGMQGHDRDGGLGFWCASGTRHRRQAFLLTLPNQVRAVTYVMAPRERIFVGTARSLQLLDGDSQAFAQVVWDYDGLPNQDDPVDGLDTLEAPEVDSGYLLAVGIWGRQQVLIAEVTSPLEGESEAPLTPRACISRDEPGFGSLVKLERLEPDGAPVLIAGDRSATEGRAEAVHIFELDLEVAPEDVECLADEPLWTLECGEIEGSPVLCPDQGSGFGLSVDVGDIDDTDEYEVLVGCPGCSADGYSSAGAGFVFRPAREGEAPLATLTDSSEDRDDAELGAGVGMIPVGDRVEPVLAAPGERSLLMFLCTGVGDAPPEWDSPTDQAGSLEDPRCRRNLLP